MLTRIKKQKIKYSIKKKVNKYKVKRGGSQDYDHGEIRETPNRVPLEIGDLLYFYNIQRNIDKIILLFDNFEINTKEELNITDYNSYNIVLRENSELEEKLQKINEEKNALSAELNILKTNLNKENLHKKSQIKRLTSVFFLSKNQIEINEKTKKIEQKQNEITQTRTTIEQKKISLSKLQARVIYIFDFLTGLLNNHLNGLVKDFNERSKLLNHIILYDPQAVETSNFRYNLILLVKKIR